MVWILLAKQLVGAIVRNALYLGLAEIIILVWMFLGLIMAIFHWLGVDLIMLALDLGLVGMNFSTRVLVGDLSLTPVLLLGDIIRIALYLGWTIPINHGLVRKIRSTPVLVGYISLIPVPVVDLILIALDLG